MLNHFVKQTIELLKRSDINIRQTEFRDVIFDNNPNGEGGHTVKIFGESYMSRTSLKENLILQIMLFFSLLDAKVDLLYPSLQGQSYKKKYEGIPKTDDESIMLSQVFRILKVLRNASIHSMSAITVQQDQIIVSYTFNGTAFYLETDKGGLELLYTYILEMVKPASANQAYSLGLRRELFNEINKHIKGLRDDFGNRGLETISTNNIRLKRVVRYIVKNAKFQIAGNNLQILQPYQVEKSCERYYGMDYVVGLNGKMYQIPAEALDGNETIALEKRSKWEMS